MSLKEKILQDLQQAQKDQDKKKLQVLRLLQSAIKNKEIELRPNPAKDEDILSVIKKQSKQVKESLDAFKKADYKDQIAEEEYNLSVLESYLPEQMSEADIQKLVQDAIQESKATSMKDMGSVMKVAKEKSQGRADGKILSDMVRDQLQKI